MLAVSSSARSVPVTAGLMVAPPKTDVMGTGTGVGDEGPKPVPSLPRMTTGQGTE